MTIDTELFTRRVGIISSAAMILIGIIGIINWVTGFYLVLDITGIVPISPVAAVAYILLGLIILSLILPLKGKYTKLMTKFLITFIMVIACMFWITAAFFPSLDIQKIIVVPLIGTASPVETEIAPLAAFAIFLGTVALVRITYHKIKWRHYDTLIGIFGVIIFSIGFMSLNGYAFGDPHFYGSSVRAVSVASSFCLVFLGLGIISLNGVSKWPSSVFSSDTVSAQMIRILIPIIIAAFLSYSWVLFRVIIPSSSEPVAAVGAFTVISLAAVAYTVSFVSARIQRIVEKARIEKDKAIEGLSLANKKLEILDSLTRHDTLNQVSLSSIEAELVRRQVENEDLRQSIDNILKINQTITGLLKFSKEYRKVGIEEPRWLRLRDLLSDAIDQLDFGKTTMDYYCEDWKIYADPMIEKAFFNILDNALRHGETVTKVLIDCAVSKEDGTLRVRFSDNGVGIPEAEKERIFEKNVGKNTGLGLFLVRQILSITGISISENGIQGKGARFEIIIPKERFKEEEWKGNIAEMGEANPEKG